jgi:hypothetical protein
MFLESSNLVGAKISDSPSISVFLKSVLLSSEMRRKNVHSQKLNSIFLIFSQNQHFREIENLETLEELEEMEKEMLPNLV